MENTKRGLTPTEGWLRLVDQRSIGFANWLKDNTIIVHLRTGERFYTCKGGVCQPEQLYKLYLESL